MYSISLATTLEHPDLPIIHASVREPGYPTSPHPTQGIEPSTDPLAVDTSPAIASEFVTIFMWSTPGIVRISHEGDEVQALGAAFIMVLSPPSPSDVITDGLTALQKPAHSGS